MYDYKWLALHETQTKVDCVIKMKMCKTHVYISSLATVCTWIGSALHCCWLLLMTNMFRCYAMNILYHGQTIFNYTPSLKMISAFLWLKLIIYDGFRKCSILISIINHTLSAYMHEILKMIKHSLKNPACLPQKLNVFIITNNDI